MTKIAIVTTFSVEHAACLPIYKAIIQLYYNLHYIWAKDNNGVENCKNVLTALNTFLLQGLQLLLLVYSVNGLPVTNVSFIH
jgi:hypothetical protein